MHHTSTGKEDRDGQRTEHRTPHTRVAPVVILAVGEQPDHLEHRGRPEQTTQPVDSQKWHGAHKTEVLRAGIDKNERHKQQTHDKILHGVIAATIVAELLRQPAAGTHVAQHHDVKQGEEYLEVALRRHPQLYVAEALKGSHQFHKTAGVRQHAEHGYRLCEQRQQNAHNHARYREQQ